MTFKMAGNKLLHSGDLQRRRLQAVLDSLDMKTFSVTSQNTFLVLTNAFL